MKIRECGRDRPDLLEKELETCTAQLDAVQNSLHFHLSFVAEGISSLPSSIVYLFCPF